MKVVINSNILVRKRVEYVRGWLRDVPKTSCVFPAGANRNGWEVVLFGWFSFQFEIGLPPKHPYKSKIMNPTGSIEIIYGPMFSGKSSELLRKIRRFEHAKKKCLIANYSHDNRYSNNEEMATHDRVTKKAVKVTRLLPLLATMENYDVVGIDEGQFFEDIIEFCEEAANSGKIVVVAALDGTFERKPFGNIINLIPLAEMVTKLSAVCVYCTREAAFTKRVVENKEVQLIGGAEMYKPVCRVCFFEEESLPSPGLTCMESECVPAEMNPEKKEGQQIMAS